MLRDQHCTDRQAYERGGGTELLFFSAMQAHRYGAPRWYFGIRHATKEQDLAGVDAHADLDIGIVPVQIKTSHAGLHKHLERYGDVHCVIVICPVWPQSLIREQSFKILYRWRRRLLTPNRHH